VEYLNKKPEELAEKIVKSVVLSRFLGSVMKFILIENLEKHFEFITKVLDLFLDKTQYTEE